MLVSANENSMVAALNSHRLESAVLLGLLHSNSLQMLFLQGTVCSCRERPEQDSTFHSTEKTDYTTSSKAMIE